MSPPRPKTDVPSLPEPGSLAIGVWMGGPSREREVSLDSGRAVAEALEALGHDVRPADVEPDDVTPDRVSGLDVIFLALHGAWGEDGTLQARLDSLGACYTGSGPAASRLAMDKVAAKERFGEKEIPTPAFRVVEAGDDGPLAEAMETLGPDLVVKPVADGSSIDIAMVETPAGLAKAVRAVWARGEPALIERRILGREFTVGILGETALPTIEIRTPGGWYDCEVAPPPSGFTPPRPATWYNYNYKYTSDDTRYVFEHGLEPALEGRIGEMALAAHHALGCHDLSRVDLMLTAAGEPEVLEINTIPGFTSHSLVPKAAARVGLSFGRLCERIVALAWTRAGAKGRPDANPNTAARAVQARWAPGRGDWQSGSGETFRR